MNIFKKLYYWWATERIKKEAIEKFKGVPLNKENIAGLNLFLVERVFAYHLDYGEAFDILDKWIQKVHFK